MTKKSTFTRSYLVGFNQRQRDEWIASVAHRLPPSTRILDLGAGKCRYRSQFAHCDYKALDFAQYQGTASGLFQDSWRFGQLDYICDVSNVPVAAGSFDADLCTEVLEHVPEPICVLKEIGRIVRRGDGRSSRPRLASVCISSPTISTAVLLRISTTDFSASSGLRWYPSSRTADSFACCCKNSTEVSGSYRCADVTPGGIRCDGYCEWCPAAWLLDG